MKKINSLFRLFLMVAFVQLVNSNATAQYCSAGSDFQNMYISRVSVGNINHPSSQGANAYEDFTSLSTIMKEGSQYQVYVQGTYVWDYSYVNIYIDLNQDGDFDDPGENVGNTDGFGDFYVNVTIPSGTATGSTRMRIRLFDSYSSGGSCGNTMDGEVEDYTVNLIPACASTSTTDTAVCASGLPFTWNSQSITASGTYTATLTNAAACDSFAIMNIKAVTPLDNIGLGCSTGAAVAYSVRKLSTTYTGYAMQVRRSSDDATQDIGFTAAGELDTAALKTFVGGDDGYVSVWYDQSGNGINLSKSTSSEQPRIVGAGILDRENRRPFIRFFGVVGSSNNSLNLPAPITTTALAIVVNKFAAGGDGFILGNNTDYFFHSDPSNSLLFASYAGSSALNGSVWQNSKAVPAASAAWNTILGINSVAPQDPASETTWNNIGSDRYTLHSTSNGGGYSELITFSSAISDADRSGAETNQGIYYHICAAPTTSDTTVSICNSYTWNGTTYKASGNYTWQGTNAAGCDSIATLHLNILSIANTFTKTDAVCYGSATGSIHMEVANTGYVGTPPYTYRLGVTGGITSSVNTFSNLKAGSYRTYVQDSKGCIGVAAPVVIAQDPQVSASTSATSTSCYGAADGTITITNPMGYTPFMYKITLTGSFNTLTEPGTTISNLKAGNYRVYVQDAHGCVSRGVVTTVQHPDPVAVSTMVTPISCSTSTGTISLSSLSSPSATFKINTKNSNYSTQTMYSNLKPGTYYGYAKDAAGCIGRSAVVVLSPATGCSTFARLGTTNEDVSTKNFEVVLSPNPTTSRFTLNVHSIKNEAAKLRVTDANGRVIYTANSLPEQPFSFGETFPTGLYLLEVRQGEKVKILKAVKIRN